MKKKGNLTFVALIALLVVCCGAAVLTTAANSKYNAKMEYKRLESRYIAESGVDTSVGLFLNYLSNRDLTLTYSKSEGGEYIALDEYSPYLLDEILAGENDDKVPINIVANESKDYLAATGNLDFIKEGSIEVFLNTYGTKEEFKISKMCVEPYFLLSTEEDNSVNKESKLNPIFLTITAKYREGEVLANIKISGLKAVRKPFRKLDEYDKGSVEAWIDVSDASITYENYQNYRGNRK